MGDPLQVAELIAIAEMSGPTGTKSAESGGNDNIRLAAGLSVEAVERYCQEMITEREVRGAECIQDWVLSSACTGCMLICGQAIFRVTSSRVFSCVRERWSSVRLGQMLNGMRAGLPVESLCICCARSG